MEFPRWLTKAKLKLLAEMKPEAALAEFARLKEAHNARKRAKWFENHEHNKEWRRNYNKRYAASGRAAEVRRGILERMKEDPERWAHHVEKVQSRQRVYPYRPQTDKERANDRRKHQRGKTRKWAREKPQELRKLILALLPGYLSPPARMDVISAVMADALAHKIEFDKLAEAVKANVSHYNRQFDYFKTVSIDAPIAGTDDLTRADLIDSETFHF